MTRAGEAAADRVQRPASSCRGAGVSAQGGKGRQGPRTAVYQHPALGAPSAGPGDQAGGTPSCLEPGQGSDCPLTRRREPGRFDDQRGRKGAGLGAALTLGAHGRVPARGPRARATRPAGRRLWSAPGLTSWWWGCLLGGPGGRKPGSLGEAAVGARPQWAQACCWP